MSKKNTIATINWNELNDNCTIAYQQYEKAMEMLVEANQQKKEAKQAKLNALIQTIESCDRPMMAREIADMTEGNFSKQSVAMFGVMAKEARLHHSSICDNPSIPNLMRDTKRVVRHYIECDETGTPISNKIFSQEYDLHAYFIEK